jgi:exodeoxyribonuclease V alpha subunit
MSDGKQLSESHGVADIIADTFEHEKPEPIPSAEQYRAINMCCDLTIPIASVTGGAGTGKTFVLGKVKQSLREDGISAVLCAPTGRAAKRIQELTGIPAMTVHRMLEYPMPTELGLGEPSQPRRNRQNPLNQRVVIVDESSMLSTELYRNLLDALPRYGVIRFFGDDNQLPPVEEYEDGKATSPFAKALDKFPKVVLSYNFRNEDLILDNAQRILRGNVPRANARFVILYDDNPIRRLIEFVKDHRDFTQSNHQIIIPTRRGQYGTARVNPSLQLIYNGYGPMLRLIRYDSKEAPLAVRANDKFLWIKNDYQLELFNGEIGEIEWLSTEDGELGLRTSDRLVNVPARLKAYSPYHGGIIYYDPRKQIELGYAVTTHKAQGSEFDSIVYCMTGGQAYLLNKRNFYTAVTRARKLVVVITDRRAMSYSMRRYL